MRATLFLTAVVGLVASLPVRALPPDAGDADVERAFNEVVRPFLKTYCIDCHGGEKPEAQLDLGRFSTMQLVVQDHLHWASVRQKLAAKQMPPKDAEQQPSSDTRQQIIDWISTMRTVEAKKHAGDPGVVLARRLSNAEYNYTIRDLVGHDLRPTREFPVDPANPAGFDNSGESLSMSPALMTKYLQAAREVANHMALRLNGIDFAPHPMLVETDRDKYCVGNIIDFYKRQNTDYADYFYAAWRYKHRSALGKPQATLGDIAAQGKLSAKYLGIIWRFLEATPESIGPGAKLQANWRVLPAPNPNEPASVRTGCAQMRDWVRELRAKIEPRFTNLSAGSIKANSQPFLMWKNRQYATHRRTFDHGALQVQGETQIAKADPDAPENEPGADNEFGPGKTRMVRNKKGDPDLLVPAVKREQYEAAFERFCSVFPDNFYVAERGRNYLDKSKDKGRYLSAGFHNVMGYFRDDQPLYELILDDAQQKQLDALWRELDFIASGNIRTHVQFYFNESGEARGTSRESEGPRPKDLDVISEKMVMDLKETYLGRVKASNNDIAIKAIEDHFTIVNDSLRWVERARLESEPKHLQALQEFAARAYRRPLTGAERSELLAFYASLRKEAGLDHESAMRDCVVLVLMSPDFCYRVDLANSGPGIRPLSDYALASRLSYFLWSSMPDAELLSHAAAGDLHQPEVIASQAKRMLKDPRVRGLAVEFGGNWLDFRRFEELNTVDRELFTGFGNDLRSAMFEEPIRFMLDVFENDHSVLDFLYANHTFVNATLAKHYGMPEPNSPEANSPDQWVRADNAEKFGRGGLLPMAAFLTQNAPGLRTSPVKRGYWVVKRVLGEEIPPPPAAVPELPRDEAKMDLPLRETLAKHREDPSCASCHMRFDALGLVFEGFGPIGERRTKDLAGRPVDARATFPGGSEGDGFEGARNYIREHRQNDFVDGLSRKLLAYALGRSLILSDDLLIDEMREKLVKDDYRFASFVESIVTSPQFLNKRGREQTVQR